MPPYLAGRETEQRFVTDLLDRLAEGSAPESDVVMFGPRGCGKTVLMKWSLSEAQARKVRTVDFLGGQLASQEELIRGVSARTGWMRLFSPTSVLGRGISTRAHNTLGRFSDVLARRTRNRPLVIAIDEAQGLGIELGHALLNAVHRLRRKGSPILLMLVGTPNLPHHLYSTGASFWDRGAVLRIGRLTSEAAAEAIRIPLEDRGYSISSTALGQVVRESEAHPFLVQLLGWLLWNTLRRSSGSIASSKVEEFRGKFEDKRDGYFLGRYEELRREGLARVAASVSGVYSGADRATTHQVKVAIGKALGAALQRSGKPSVAETLGRLRDLGYLWSVSHGSRCYLEPGIPSLMRYVARSKGLVRESQPSRFS